MFDDRYIYEFPCGCTCVESEKADWIVRTVGTLNKGQENTIKYGPRDSMKCAQCKLRECAIFGTGIRCIARFVK